MSYAITISFPVSAHVYKYLSTKYGNKAIEASRKDSIGYQVISLLNRTPDERGKPTKKSDFEYPVSIRESHYLQNGIYIDPKKIEMFDKLIDKQLREELLMYLLINKTADDKMFTHSFRDFLAFYNITEHDINYESLFKDIKRRKSEYELIAS